MKQTLMIVAVLSGAYLLLMRKRSGDQPILTVPPVPLEYRDWLANRLQSALLYGDGPMWDELSEECRRIGKPDLPGHVSGEFPELEQRLNWPKT